MLSLASQRRSIQNNNPATRPSRLMSMTRCRDGCGRCTCLHMSRWDVCVELKLHVTVSGVSWTTPRHQHAHNKNLRPAESAAVRGGKLQSKGLGFGARCNKPSRLHTLLTHRNLRHARRRLKRAFRFRKFFGYFLPKLFQSCTLFASRHGP
jgi:hypothetical protein